MKIMEHKMIAVHCDSEKCQRSGNDKRDILVDFLPQEPPPPAQMLTCPYCDGRLERNIPGEVRRIQKSSAIGNPSYR